LRQRSLLASEARQADSQSLGLGAATSGAVVDPVFLRLAGLREIRATNWRVASASGACAFILVARVIASVDSASSLPTGFTLSGLGSGAIALVQGRWLQVAVRGECGAASLYHPKKKRVREHS